MKKHSSENYLDQLLNTVNETEGVSDAMPSMEESEMDLFERELLGAPETKEELTAKAEEDFLREFEADLLKDEIPDFAAGSLDNMPRKQSVDADIDGMLAHMEQVPPVDEDAEFEGEIPEAIMPEDILPENTGIEESVEEQTEISSLDEAVNAFDGELEQKVTEDGELDLSGLAGNCLLYTSPSPRDRG